MHVHTQCYYTARPILTNESSKRVIRREGMPFVSDLNDASLNIGSQIAKKLIFLILLPLTRLSSVNDKKFKYFYRAYPPWMGLRGWSHRPTTSSSSSLFVPIKIHDAQQRANDKTWTGQQGGKPHLLLPLNRKRKNTQNLHNTLQQIL